MLFIQARSWEHLNLLRCVCVFCSHRKCVLAERCIVFQKRHTKWGINGLSHVVYCPSYRNKDLRDVQSNYLENCQVYVCVLVDDSITIYRMSYLFFFSFFFYQADNCDHVFGAIIFPFFSFKSTRVVVFVIITPALHSDWERTINQTQFEFPEQSHALASDWACHESWYINNNSNLNMAVDMIPNTLCTSLFYSCHPTHSDNMLSTQHDNIINI